MLSKQDRNQLIDYVTLNQEVNISEFLDKMMVNFDWNTKDLIGRIFDRLDVLRQGKVLTHYILNKFQCERHPLVVSGQKDQFIIY